ncbi:hypothetical protein PAMP_005632 [Pampus punctatissimus]
MTSLRCIMGILLAVFTLSVQLSSIQRVFKATDDVFIKGTQVGIVTAKEGKRTLDVSLRR